jgi:hypothetical protein
VDAWSVGAVIAQLYHPTSPAPVMPGKDDADQLARTFMFAGTPSQRGWSWATDELVRTTYKDADVLANARKRPRDYTSLESLLALLHRYSKVNKLKRVLPGLLTLDPARRWTVADVLERHW